MLRLFDLGSQERITAGITADLFLMFFGRQVKHDCRRGNRTEATTDLGQFSHMLRLRLVFNPKSSSRVKGQIHIYNFQDVIQLNSGITLKY